jgi:hypothetical protein
MSFRAPPDPQNLYVGKGQCLFNRFDPVTGLPTVYKHLGNIDSMDITTADTKIQKYSAMSAASPLLEEVTTRRIVTLTLKGSEFHPDNMALVTLGKVNTLTQASTAVVAEPVSATTVPGMYFVTQKLGPITAVTVTFGSTPGVAGVDYVIVDAAVGMIHILPTTILTGAITVGYTPTAYTGPTGLSVVAGGTEGKIQGALKFIGDPTAGPKQIVDVWRVNVSPNGAIGLISDNFADLSLTMTVQDDSANHPASPLYQSLYMP